MEELSLTDINKKYVNDHVKWCVYAYYQTHSRTNDVYPYVTKLNTEMDKLVENGFVRNYKVQLLVNDFNFKKYKRNLVIDSVESEDELDLSHLQIHIEYTRSFGIETLSFNLEKKYEIRG